MLSHNKILDCVAKMHTDNVQIIQLVRSRHFLAVQVSNFY